jgi:hypothetical protein
MSSPVTALSTSEQIFNSIRGEEANFPFPVSTKTFTVGTFDARTGRFTYAVRTQSEKFNDGGKPTVLTGGIVDAVNVVDVTLRFKIRNAQGTVTASVAGVPPVRSDSGTIDVPIGGASSVGFTLSAGARTFESELPLEINRLLANAGVFTMPAFPIAIVYAPPVDRAKKNSAKWTVTNSTGNTSTVSVANAQTTSRSVLPKFDNVNVMVSIMKTFSEALGLVPDSALAKGMSIALDKVAGILGSASASESKGMSVTKEGSVSLSVANQQTVSTNAAAGGPGSGDLIFYLKNVRLAYFTDSVGPIRITVIGHDGIAATSVAFLKSGGQTDLDAATVEQFLGLDPFVAGGPSAALPTKRFVYMDTIDINGGQITLAETHSITTQQSKETVVTETRIENNKPGLFRLFGIGVTEEESVQTTLTHKSAVQSQDGRSISNTVELFAQPDERYCVEMYCDVVFGTFAYRQIKAAGTPQLTGTAFLSAGKAAAGELVVLTNNGRKFTTRTDAAGGYSFRASTIKQGSSQLEVKGIKRQFMLTPGMKQDVTQ